MQYVCEIPKSVGISVVTSLVELNSPGLDGKTSDRGRSLVFRSNNSKLTIN
jgi:hypothetical protein